MSLIFTIPSEQHAEIICKSSGVWAIIFFKYEGEMYKAECECSEDIKRTVFKYYLYSIYVILVLQILFMIFFIAMMVYTSNQKSVVKVNL